MKAEWFSFGRRKIQTDKLRLNQLLLNILSNALKFTNERGNISLKVSEEEIKTEENYF